MEKDIEYPSRFKNNRFDTFSGKNATGRLSTILWTHGGGFVGGDKAGVETWATIIAARGYNVASINYELAPQNHFPGPVIQLGEVHEFLKRNPQPKKPVATKSFHAERSPGNRLSRWSRRELESFRSVRLRRARRKICIGVCFLRDVMIGLYSFRMQEAN
jgi:hypothetical protein